MDEHEGLTKAELEHAAAAIVGGAVVEELSTSDIIKALTIGQYLSDRCLAEIEKRGEVEWIDGQPCIPYASEHVIETVLTRE